MTAIEWTDQTWNPVTGCDRVSPGCDHCYALTLAARLKAMGQAKYQRDVTRPRLADLFSGAGGAARGYHDAGFEVVGVDHIPQPRYPYEHHVADALTFDLAGFDAVHASPPCQAYSRSGTSRRRRDHPDLVAATRARLRAAGVPYVIENIPGAPIENAFVLCGATFGLPIVRHRLFETDPWMLAPMTCPSVSSNQVTGHGPGYYPYARGSWESAWREHVLPVVWPWMTLKEAGQAIPPAYTRWIGEQLMAHLEGRAA